MINMVQNAKDQAAALAMAAYQAAVADGTLPEAEVKTAPVEIPKDTANGDFTTTFALAASKALRQPPRNIAQALLDHMDLAGELLCLRGDCGTGLSELPSQRQLVRCRLRGGGERGCRLRHRRPPEGAEDHGGIRLRQPHGPHAHGQCPGRRAGRHPGQRAGGVRRRRDEGVFT